METAICTTPSLSAKDDLLNEHYRPLQHLKIFRELERQWLREVRNRCTAVPCIEEAYDQQISRLTPVPANPQAETPALKPAQDQQPYLQIEDAAWQRFALASFPQVKGVDYAQVVDVATLDGVLNVVIFVGEHLDQTIRSPGNS
ncbi:hypothetical protein D9M73_221870 [compost metagenome]